MGGGGGGGANSFLLEYGAFSVWSLIIYSQVILT